MTEGKKNAASELNYFEQIYKTKRSNCVSKTERYRSPMSKIRENISYLQKCQNIIK